MSFTDPQELIINPKTCLNSDHQTIEQIVSKICALEYTLLLQTPRLQCVTLTQHLNTHGNILRMKGCKVSDKCLEMQIRSMCPNSHSQKLRIIYLLILANSYAVVAKMYMQKTITHGTRGNGLKGDGKENTNTLNFCEPSLNHHKNMHTVQQQKSQGKYVLDFQSQSKWKNACAMMRYQNCYAHASENTKFLCEFYRFLDFDMEKQDSSINTIFNLLNKYPIIDELMTKQLKTKSNNFDANLNLMQICCSFNLDIFFITNWEFVIEKFYITIGRNCFTLKLCQCNQFCCNYWTNICNQLQNGNKMDISNVTLLYKNPMMIQNQEQKQNSFQEIKNNYTSEQNLMAKQVRLGIFRNIDFSYYEQLQNFVEFSLELNQNQNDSNNFECHEDNFQRQKSEISIIQQIISQNVSMNEEQKSENSKLKQKSKQKQQNYKNVHTFFNQNNSESILRQKNDQSVFVEQKFQKKEQKQKENQEKQNKNQQFSDLNFFEQSSILHNQCNFSDGYILFKESLANSQNDSSQQSNDAKQNQFHLKNHEVLENKLNQNDNQRNVKNTQNHKKDNEVFNYPQNQKIEDDHQNFLENQFSQIQQRNDNFSECEFNLPILEFSPNQRNNCSQNTKILEQQKQVYTVEKENRIEQEYHQKQENKDQKNIQTDIKLPKEKVMIFHKQQLKLDNLGNEIEVIKLQKENNKNEERKVKKIYQYKHEKQQKIIDQKQNVIKSITNKDQEKPKSQFKASTMACEKSQTKQFISELYVSLNDKNELIFPKTAREIKSSLQLDNSQRKPIFGNSQQKIKSQQEKKDEYFKNQQKQKERNNIMSKFRYEDKNFFEVYNEIQQILKNINSSLGIQKNPKGHLIKWSTPNKVEASISMPKFPVKCEQNAHSKKMFHVHQRNPIKINQNNQKENQRHSEKKNVSLPKNYFLEKDQINTKQQLEKKIKEKLYGSVQKKYFKSIQKSNSKKQYHNRQGILQRNFQTPSKKILQKSFKKPQESSFETPIKLIENESSISKSPLQSVLENLLVEPSKIPLQKSYEGLLKNPENEGRKADLKKQFEISFKKQLQSPLKMNVQVPFENSHRPILPQQKPFRMQSKGLGLAKVFKQVNKIGLSTLQPSKNKQKNLALLQIPEQKQSLQKTSSSFRAKRLGITVMQKKK